MKTKIIFIVLAIGFLGIVKGINKSQSKTLLISSEGCCSIYINNASKTIKYTSSELSEVELYESNKELDEIINSMQEYCLHTHFNN